jgi:alkylated DNA repair protein (DNA oxidative demethylase)
MRLLPGFVPPDSLLPLIRVAEAAAPFRHMKTRRGGQMAAAMTSVGACGWITDTRGYRYESLDPLTGLPWPPMPEAFQTLATRAAEAAGFPGFAPDTCLINRYAARAGMGLHRDGDERDFAAPIVSVSLGLPAVFLIGGAEKTHKATPLPLASGDVLVFGGPARLLFHGIRPVKQGEDALFGPFRYNLTFRRAR